MFALKTVKPRGSTLFLLQSPDLNTQRSWRQVITPWRKCLLWLWTLVTPLKSIHPLPWSPAPTVLSSSWQHVVPLTCLSDSMTPDTFSKEFLSLRAPHCHRFSSLQGDRNEAEHLNHNTQLKQKMCFFRSLDLLQKAIWRQGSSIPQGWCLKAGGLEKDLCTTSRSSCLVLKWNGENELKEDQKCKYLLWKFYCP